MCAFEARRVVRSYTQTIFAGPERVFQLLCPVREAEWLDGWRYRAIHLPSGFAEKNGVFVSMHPDGSDTVWLITQRDEEGRLIEFVYFVPDSRVTRLNIAVRPDGEGRSRVEIVYVHTGISEAGNREIEERCNEERFVLQMKRWEDSMNHFLATGKMLATA